jgi:hypothetical protein
MLPFTYEVVLNELHAPGQIVFLAHCRRSTATFLDWDRGGSRQIVAAG